MKRMMVVAMMLAGALMYADAVLAWGPGSGGSGSGGPGAGGPGAGAGAAGTGAAGSAGTGAAGAAGTGAAGAAGTGAAAGAAGEAGDGVGGALTGYSWERDRSGAPATAPASGSYPQASPRSGAFTPPVSDATVPATPLICPNVNPDDPRKC